MMCGLLPAQIKFKSGFTVHFYKRNGVVLNHNVEKILSNKKDF